MFCPLQSKQFIKRCIVLSCKHICPSHITYMPYMAYLPLLYTGDVCTYMCHIYQVTRINHVTRRTVHILYKLHLLLLTYITEQMWLPHCKYSSHCTHSAWEYGCDIGSYRCQTQKQMQHLPYMSLSSLCLKQTCLPNYTCIPCVIYEGHMWSMYVHICATYEVSGINHVAKRLYMNENYQNQIVTVVYSTTAPGTLGIYQPLNWA